MWRIIFLITLVVGGGCDERSAKSVPASAPAVAPGAAGFERSEIITLTPLAAQKVREMSQGRDVTTTAYLRVGVEPATAPQFRYLLDITEAADPKNDLLGNSQGVRIVVDRKASLYLVGTKIDYRKRGNGSGFWFDNPNAQTQPSGNPR
jgi:iron-sulfur cluster assembly protein